MVGRGMPESLLSTIAIPTIAIPYTCMHIYSNSNSSTITVINYCYSDYCYTHTCAYAYSNSNSHSCPSGEKQDPIVEVARPIRQRRPKSGECPKGETHSRDVSDRNLGIATLNYCYSNYCYTIPVCM